jgi:hypothetical protein
MLSRLFGRGPTVVPDTDVAMADLDLRTARTHALAGDWRAARDVVEAAGTDWELRGRRIAALGTAAVWRSTWLDAWLAEQPDDPTAATVAADTLDRRAWDARGRSSAKYTSADQFRAFADLSARAEAASRRAIALAPDDPVPWQTVLYAKLAAGRAQRGEFFEAYEEATRRDPHNFETQHAAVVYLCEKWFGSHTEMFAAARSAATAAPAGSTTAMLPVLAHFEYAMRQYGWTRRGERTRAVQRRYFKRREVRQELDACVAKWRTGGARLTGRGMTCRHWQLIAYALAGRRDEARTVLDEIGLYLGDTPAWGFFWLDQPTGFLSTWYWAYRQRPPHPLE